MRCVPVRTHSKTGYMITLAEIKKPYAQELHAHEGFLMREYLQYRVLGIIFSSPFAEKLVFLGGTCLRIVHGNRRFSEDIDFDNLGLTKPEFAQVGNLVKLLAADKKTASLTENHPTSLRPWGGYTSVLNGQRFRVNKTMIRLRPRRAMN